MTILKKKKAATATSLTAAQEAAANKFISDYGAIMDEEKVTASKKSEMRQSIIKFLESHVPLEGDSRKLKLDAGSASLAEIKKDHLDVEGFRATLDMKTWLRISKRSLDPELLEREIAKGSIQPKQLKPFVSTTDEQRLTVRAKK